MLTPNEPPETPEWSLPPRRLNPPPLAMPNTWQDEGDNN